MRRSLVLAGIALVSLGLPVAAVGQDGGPGGDRSKGSLNQCGDYPEDFTYGLRVQGVACSRGKDVSERWYRQASDRGFPRVVKFGQWRCTSENYGDGANVKCKKGGSKEVRFAHGG